MNTIGRKTLEDMIRGKNWRDRKQGRGERKGEEKRNRKISGKGRKEEENEQDRKK
jgi:hypothetical protein